MLISDHGILASLLALKNKDIEGVLDPHEMKVVMKNKMGDPESGSPMGTRASSRRPPTPSIRIERPISCTTR